MFIMTSSAIYSLHILTAVSRLTQHSMLREMAK